MIDFDDIVSLVRMYYRVAIGIAVMLALVLIFWFCRGYGGREEVTAKIDEIKTTTEVHERRVDDIIEAVKAKEATAKNETMDLVNARSADALPDLLSGLLADYRKDRR